MAPEALDGKYHEKSDIWSCGVILCLLLTGVYPFEGETDEEIFQSIRECNYSFYKPE